jgi:hypothetical protein
MESKRENEQNKTQKHDSENVRQPTDNKNSLEHTDVSNITSEGSGAGIPVTERTIGGSTKKGVTGSDYDGQVAP